MHDITVLSLMMIALSVIKTGIATHIADSIMFRSKIPFDKIQALKFQLSTWKILYYAFSCIYGYINVKDETWIYDVFEYLTPFTVIPSRFKMYYLFSFAYYINESLSHAFQPKTKDSSQMILHHIVTILLMYVSYSLNLAKPGVLILLLHDISDPFLECAKICVYLKKELMANMIFFNFVIVFIFTRLYVYPTYLVIPIVNMYSSEKYRTMKHTIIAICLLSLQVMHIIWTYYILLMLRRIIFEKSISDVRSTAPTVDEVSESSSSDE